MYLTASLGGNKATLEEALRFIPNKKRVPVA
jgi:hypothetical protein